MDNTTKKVIGYKVFNSDWTCLDFQYEIGKTYKHKGKIKQCESGFHFCLKLVDCFKYYNFNPKNKVAVVEASGEIISDDDKSVCSTIKIIKELTWNECLDLVNNGKGNSGHSNSGNRNSSHYNSGNRNSGDYNSGNRNSGDYNSGNRNSSHYNSGHYNSGNHNSSHYNSGHYNSGDYNSGDYNSGHYNSGDYNSGHYNSGDYNSGHYNSGLFNTNEPFIRLFNKNTKLKYDDVMNIQGVVIIRDSLWQFSSKWVNFYEMTDEEKKNNPTATQGYLKVIEYKTMWRDFWKSLSKENKKEITKIPNFSWKIFTEITGIEEE